VERVGMIVDEAPVADVLPGAVDGDWPPARAFRVTTGINFPGNWYGP
jgi:hypothetical protein